MIIEFEYLLLKDEEPQQAVFTEEEYFDPLDPEDVSFWKSGISRYTHPHEYLGLEPSELKWLIVRLIEEEKKRIYRNQYLNGDDSMITQTKDEFGQEEIIYSRNIGDSYHIVRILKPENESWTVTMNTVASDVKVDGIYPYETLTKNWTFKELKAFSKIT